MNHVQPQGNTQSQTQIFAEKFQADAADGMLATIKRGFKRASVLTLIVLGVSMPHQISYLVSECAPFLNWTAWNHVVESVGMLMIAGSVPVVSDLVIISCIEQISTKAMARTSRWRAVAIIVAPLAVSGFVNFAAPAPTLLKCLAAFLVLCILLIETLKFAKPDFRAIEEMQQEILSQVTPDAAPVVRNRFKTAKAKVEHILTTEPGLKADAVAKRAAVSVNYVYTVKRELKNKVDA